MRKEILIIIENTRESRRVNYVYRVPKTLDEYARRNVQSTRWIKSAKRYKTLTAAYREIEKLQKLYYLNFRAVAVDIDAGQIAATV